jgi:hypothetical protein
MQSYGLLQGATDVSDFNQAGWNEPTKMEQFYKNHRIEVSLLLDNNTWTVSLFIYYSEGSQNILVTFGINQNFKTYDEAIDAGLAAAKKWIDEKTFT